MTPKSDVPTLQPPAAQAGSADFVAQWSEARNAYPLYAALAAQFNFGPLPYPAGELPPQRPTRDVFDTVLKWLDGIDARVRAFQVRQLPPETLNASEQDLRAFLQRQLRKQEKTTADRDKIDLLLVQYFALCAPEELYRKEIHLEDVAEVLQPVLAGADATHLDWCAPLDQILDKVSHCESLRDMMELGLLEQGRLLKESAGAMFYDPAALVAFCRFNFLLRRAFIRMLHADLSAVRQAAETLDANGVKTVDCRRAGFSAAETTTQLRYYCENWKQPFHKDYTETSVTHAFEQLLALRADLEEALAHGQPGAPVAAVRPETRQPDKRSTVDQSSKLAVSAIPVPKAPQASATQAPAAQQSAATPAEKTAPAKPADASAAAAKTEKPASDAPAPPAGALDKEKCLESIWEQLIAEPPSRGRSMSTIVLQNTKVLLSSWEVAAFVAEGDQEAEDLRRAVVARALLAVATEERKRSGDLSQLGAALTLAKAEVSYFQGRVEQAKRAKNTEAAVNLGISTKRLLSFIEEAEKLQP
ncbi:MAG: hypothetical protein ABSC10_08915 [Candidatus Acidiferrales bacterium]